MARSNATNFTGPLQFPYATAGTDIFRKEDVQTLAQAVDQHDHSAGKGLIVNTAALPAGSIAGSALADGGVTSAKIADGTIVAADLADAGITNAKLGPDVARANLLTNGGFEIWQRGNGPFTGGVYSADRWFSGLAGTDTLSVSRDTTNMDATLGSKACAAAIFVLGTGAGGTYLVNQVGNDSAQVANRVLSFSMRVRTSTPNAVRLAIYTGSAFVNGAYHSGGGAYETLTVTATMGSGVQAGNAAVNFVASCTAYLDNAMLVVGSQRADYVPLHPADDLARCLRYYEQSPGNYIGNGYGLTTTVADILYRLNAFKGGVPTITLGAPSAFTLRVIGANIAVTAISSSSPSQAAVLLNPTIASGLSVGGGVTLSATGGAITAEWNP
jgi:hypothetical protein